MSVTLGSSPVGHILCCLRWDTDLSPSLSLSQWTEKAGRSLFPNRRVDAIGDNMLYVNARSIFDSIRRILWLLQENANADDVHRRLQVQFTNDAYSIRNVRRWRQFIKQRQEDLHAGPKSGPPIDFIDTDILSALERVHFIMHAHSLRS
jgi:hypothetical protein